MADDIAIKVEHVSKDFMLPHEKITSVKSAFTGIFNLDRTKEMQHALKDVSFEVKRGEFFGIVGRNGSGKSTMLKILAGIYQPTKGKVHARGKLVPFIELGVGFNPELTGRENVYLNGAMLGFSVSEVDAMYDDIVAFAELERFMDQKLKNYSSGMEVRLAFSMATRAEADILLIDEVLAVGDAAFQRKCLEYFRKLKKNGTTVVFVSHDMDAVRQFCDKAVLIESSELIHAGSADAVAEKYTRLFIEEAKREAESESQGESIQQNRWGSGAVQIHELAVDAKVITDETKQIEIHGLLAAKKDERVILGFRVCDDSGQAITGSNTMLMHYDDISLRADSRTAFVWCVPNIFSNGGYSIDISVLDQNNTPLDVWEEALRFRSMRSEKTPFIVAPLLGFKLDK